MGKDMQRERIRKLFANIMHFVALLAAISLVARYGFYIPEEYAELFTLADEIVIGGFLLNSVIQILLAKNRLAYLKANFFEYIIAFLLVAQLFILRYLFYSPMFTEIFQKLNMVSLTQVYIVIFQVYIVFQLIVEFVKVNSALNTMSLPPYVLLAGSFAITILIGSGLLSLPKATHTGISYINALFTATSATCVTGLIVVDTGKYFTIFGQIIILILIQLGGLGIMTFAAFFAIMTGRGMDVRHNLALRDVLAVDVIGHVKSTLTLIVLYTFFIESAGFFVLNWLFKKAGEPSPFSALFHSISAFCNAGFSLYTTNISGFKHNIPVILTFAVLIILGGLGFVVLVDLGRGFIASFGREKVPILSLHSKIVLTTTIVLIILGGLIFYALEMNNSLAEFPLGEKLVNAFFQAITPRTAGFNTLDFSSMTLPVYLLVILLMVIGASPGSTGGGIKTTTFAVLLGLVRAKVRGDPDVNMFNRSIPKDTIDQAFVVLSLALATIFTGTFIMSITEGYSLTRLLFEEVSAFSTVGLSMGITSHLSSVGKLVITATMFVGRLGPMAFAYTIVYRAKPRKTRYIEEKVIIG